MSVTYPEKPSAEQKEDMSTFLTVLSKVNSSRPLGRGQPVLFR
jgi:hypothetical protein